MRLHVAVLFMSLSLAVGVAHADPVVIAGSDSPPASPPSFWEDSYYPLSPTLDWAFPFTLTQAGQFRLEELEVAAHHYDGAVDSTAFFSIKLDDNGLPGQTAARFRMQGISTEPQVLSATLSENVVLDSDTPYWIVGSTTTFPVGWNLGDGTFGPRAYLEHGGEWVYDDYGNVAAFTVLGTPVPEPATLGLLALGGLLLVRRQ